MLSALFRSSAERAFARALTRITGAAPRQLHLYHLALTHTSFVRQSGTGAPLPGTVAGRSVDTNERLEFLGDAVLGAVVAEYLFRKFPYEAEGFLTEMRSRIVNRESLNLLAVRVGIDKLIKADRSQMGRNRSLNGNALEALVGAVYLDQGYRPTRAFILEKLIKPYIDVATLASTTANFKSKLIEWAQAQGRAIRFELRSQERSGGATEFRSEVFIEEKLVAAGAGLSRKASEQAAAEKSLKEMGVL